MKNIRKSIKIVIALCFVAILATVACLLVWQKPASVSAETATDENDVQLVINEYNDGQAELNEDGSLSVTSGVLGETVDISGGNWYTDGLSDVYYCDALAEDGGSISFDARTMMLSASYETDEAAVYNNIEARASDDLAEHAVGNAVVDMEAACSLMSDDINDKAAFVNLKRNTYNNDGIMTTSFVQTEQSWYEYDVDQLNTLLEYTSSKSKKTELELRINDKALYYVIKDAVPEFIFSSVGKKAFIGKEYGFLCNVKSVKEFYNNKNRLGYEYTISTLLVFTIERILHGRQYEVTTKMLFNGYGTYISYKGLQSSGGALFQKSEETIGYSLADPVTYASIKNIYDKNSYMDNYDYQKDRDISIAQLRMNYSGFAGKKERKGYNLSEETPGIVFGLDMDLLDLGMSLAGVGLKTNIITYLVGKVIQGVMTAHDSLKTNYVNISANNERNILTFPSPSQSATKGVLSAYGYSGSGGSNNSSLLEAKNLLVYEDGAKAKLLLGALGHYAQSIYVLNEVNKPVMITTFLDFAIGADLSNTYDSDIQKFHIPDKFNYSGAMERVFDDDIQKTVKQDVETDISIFGRDYVRFNVEVGESGDYDIYLRDFHRLRVDDRKPNKIKCELNDSYVNELIHENNYQNDVFYAATASEPKFDTDVGAVVFKRKFHKGVNTFTAQLSYYKNSPCLGYNCRVSIARHARPIEEIIPVNVSLDAGQYVDYVFTPNRTGIYNIERGSMWGSIRIDVLNMKRNVILSNQIDCETLMIEDMPYYIVVKNDSGSHDNTLMQITPKENVFMRKFVGSIDARQKGAWFPLVIPDGGAYTFTLNYGDVCLWLKDSLQREMLYGADKTYLNAGVYYLYIESLSVDPVIYNVSVDFTPDEIKTDSSRVVFNDTSYKYVPVVSGKYEISVGDGYAVTVDGGAYERAEYGGGEIALERGVPYIITAKATGEKVVGAQLKINFVPQGGIYGFNSPIDAATTSATFVTRISGEFLLDGEGVAAYTEGMTAVQAVNGRYWFDAGETYYIVKGEGVRCEVVLYARQVPVNSKFNVQPNGVYYYLLCPVKDGEHTVSVRGGSAFSLYTHDGLAADVALASTGGAYTLAAGAEYYLRVETAGSPELVTVSSGGSDALPSMVEDMTVEETYSAGNDRTVYTFTPDASGKYKFVFFRERSAAFTVSVTEGGKTIATESFGSMNYVLSFVLELRGGVTYEIENRLGTAIADETALAFGVSKTTTGSLNVVVDGESQTDGTVNRIALGDDRNGLTYMQIAVQNLFGNASYRALNAPIVNGSAAVRVNANGLLEVSNRLAQWTAFAVEVNVGRCEYGDVVIDEGITRVINFVVYNKVENIQIVDGNDAAITVIDIAPKASVDLRARIYPMFAAQAETVTFTVSEADRQFVDVSGSGEYVTVTGRAVTDNNKYAKVYVSCADEFTVVVMIRVHAEEIYARKQSDLDALSEAHSAYEVIVETSVIKSIDLSGLRNVNYLKVRGSSVTKLNWFTITVGADDFDLVLENIEIYGSESGTVQSLGKKLTVHFKGDVKLYGADSLNDSLPTGRSAIVADALYLRQYEKSAVGIYGGAGYSYGTAGTEKGGKGGAAIAAASVDITTVSDFIIRGGAGGRGMIGKDGKDAGETDGRGSTGEKGAAGGDGGYGIDSSRLTISGGSIGIYGGGGGRGGTGGVGGKGKSGEDKTGENGCDGGNGGSGGFGGRGSQATSASCNWQSGWVNVSGDDGKQGNGGRGGRGGDGGSGKNDTSVGAKSSPGGNGGNGGLGGSGYVNGLRGDGGNGGDGGDPGANGPGERGGDGGSGYNGGHGGAGASTGHTWQAGGRGGKGGDAYGGSVGVGGKGGTGGLGAKDGDDGANGVQYGVDPAV